MGNNKAQNTVKVAIVDSSKIICGGLRAIIERFEGFVVECTMEQVPQNSVENIDIVIINPKTATTATIKQAFTGAKIIAILYEYTDQNTLKKMDGTIELNSSTASIEQTLRQCLQAKNSIVGDADNELSDREQEILIAVAKGLLNKEIAEEHNISIHTVVAHRKNISKKIGIRSVSGLVVYALLNNMITEEDVIF